MSFRKYIKELLGGKRSGEWMMDIISFFFPNRPLNDKKYICICMKGVSCGCNLKPLSQYIESVESNAKVVWGFVPEVYMTYKHLVKNAVKLNSWRYYWELYTAKYFISNERSGGNEFPRKRRGQIYLQTWHGSGPKMAEADIEWPDDRYEKGARQDSKLIDVIISGNHYQTDKFRDSFWYNGRVEEIGTPRNDIFFSKRDDIIHKVHNNLNIPKDSKIILYAPTFRATKDSFDFYDFDAKLLVNLLNKKFGGNFILVVRLHPNLLKYNNIYRLQTQFPDAVNACKYPDMQELLYASDILITDYSSSMFDFALTGKPCFLYVKDWEDFERGFYVKIKELPYPLMVDNESMKSAIENFDELTYKKKLNEFVINVIGSVEDGHACERCYNLLKSL